MLSLVLMAGCFGFEKAQVAWKYGNDSIVVYIAEHGNRTAIFRYMEGELVMQGLITGKKGWMVDMELLEYAEQESNFKTPQDLVNYWAIDDPVASQVVYGKKEYQTQEAGSENYMGFNCSVLKFSKGKAISGKVLRWKNLTLYWEETSGEITRKAAAYRIDTTADIPEEVFHLPEGVSSAE